MTMAPQHDARDTKDPAPPGVASVEARRRPRDLEKRRLYQIIDVRPRCPHAPQVTVQRGFVAIEELSQRAQVARRHGNNELGVAFRLSGHARRRDHGPPSSTPIKALTASHGVTGGPIAAFEWCGTTSS